MSLGTTGFLKACNFLFERTRYVKASYGTYGPWLEFSSTSITYNVWGANGDYRRIGISGARAATLGVRPTIDVPYSKLQ